MKRTIGLVGLILFAVLISSIDKADAQQNDDGSSHIAKGYEIRYSEKQKIQTNKKNSNQPTRSSTKSIALKCNAVEVGNVIPYPTATVTLKGHFYSFQGKANWLPPDPGFAGKATIIGIDSDGDCVRDDIERLIARLLPNANQKKARKYMFEYAKWRREFLKYPHLSEQSAKEISRNLYKSAECVRRVIGDNVKSQQIIDKVFSKFHDTFPRSYRYIGNNALLGGWSTREKIPVSCP